VANQTVLQHRFSCYVRTCDEAVWAEDWGKALACLTGIVAGFNFKFLRRPTIEWANNVVDVIAADNISNVGVNQRLNMIRRRLAEAEIACARRKSWSRRKKETTNVVS
jgi:hypothetical protein